MLVPNKKKFVVGFLTALAVFFFSGGQVLAQVVINEFLPNPVGGGSEFDEWIEFYNLSDQEIDLSGWWLDDLEDGGSNPHQFGSKTIAPKGFLVLSKEETGVGLNNSGDSLRLLDGQENLIDEFTYKSDPGEDKSIGRSPDGGDNWLVFESPSRGSANSQPTPINSPTSTLTPTSSPSPVIETEEEEPATCLIKSPTDSAGNVLTSVKIYVDGTYIHHYAPEELTFGSGRFCDQENLVTCDFRKHKITLEKSGFESESIEQEFYFGTEAEINLVLKEIEPTLKPTSTSTPTLKPAVTLATSSANTSTDSGKILGETRASESAFYPLESDQATPSSNSTPGVEKEGGKAFWPWLVLGAGAVFLFSGAFLVYNRLK